MVLAANRLIEAARDRLNEFGIAFEIESSPGHQGHALPTDEGIDAVATLSRVDVRARYLVLVKDPMILGSLVQGMGTQRPYPLLVVGNRISRRSAAAFRNAGIQFVDSLGNAFIEFGGVLVDVQGRTESTAHTRESGERATPTHKPVNMFSSRRSQVIFALLAWPELVTESVRQIADAAGVSAGLTHDALVQLQRAGFVSPTTRILNRTGDLLDYWTAAYPIGLGRRLEIAKFCGDPSEHVRRAGGDQPIYFSGESAEGVDITRPATLTIYLDSLDPKLPIKNRWSSSQERVPNVFVRRKFWVSPHPHEEIPSARGQNAPWPLVYADLLATGDARLAEVARAWRASRA